MHPCRNVLAKIPTGMQDEIRDGYWAIFDAEGLDCEPGPKLVELIDARIGAFADKYAATYPAAMKILLTDREGLTAYMRFPTEHHTGSGTPTSSNAPSARPAAEPKSSAASPAKPPASAWSGPS